MCNNYSLYSVYEDIVKNGSIVLRKGAFGRVSNSAKRRAMRDSSKVADVMITDMMGMAEYNRESFSTCQYGTFAEAPILIMLNYMSALCSEGADPSLRSKVRDGFNTMFTVFPMEGVPEFCFCVQTVVDYINSFFGLNCLDIDVTYALGSLIRTGDALYSNELFWRADGKGVAWYETPGPRSDIMKILENVDDNYMSN